MSFYGKIVNYVTNVFNKINGYSLDNDTMGELLLQGDNEYLVATPSKTENQVQVTFNHKEKNTTLNPIFNVLNKTNENGLLQLESQFTFDKAGHAIPSENWSRLTLIIITDDNKGNIKIEF